MKTSFTNLAAAALALAMTVQAHMELSVPPPYRSKFNKNAGQNIDYSMTAPLSGAAQFPCKGYHSDFGTAAGASVATWAAGSSTNFTVVGGAPHGGGSCQASLSYDKGATFKVVTSFVGSCPLASGDSFDFTIPSDAPSGDAIFAWTWFNKIGNREIYMNCATVTISGGSSKRDGSTAFSSRPDVFQANLGNGCTSVEGKEVIFPNPGPNVVDKQTGSNDGSLTGNCGASSGGSSGDSSGSSAAAPASSTTAVVAPSGGVFVTVATSSTEAPAATATATTFSTSASPDATPATSETPAPVTSTVAPTATSQAPSTGSGSGSGSIAAASACSPEGLWNCISGTSYQQCASGTWSVVMPLAAGTKCTAGQSASIDITAAKRRNMFA